MQKEGIKKEKIPQTEWFKPKYESIMWNWYKEYIEPGIQDVVQNIFQKRTSQTILIR